MAIKILNDLLPIANPEDLGAIIPDNKSIKITEEGKLSSQLIDIPENIVTSDNYPDAKIWKGTLAEYEAMESHDDTITYIITDDSQVIDLINDTLKSNDSTYSSNKIEELFNTFLPNKENNQNKYLKINDNNLIWDNALNYTNVTNCFSLLPKNINAELLNDVFTIKAGTKLYDANGNVDEIHENKSVNSVYTTKAPCYICIEKSTQSILLISVNDPKLTFSNNTVTYDETRECWLPLGIFIRDVAGKSKIQQLFDNFGYMNTIVFALPGIECIFSNGYNKDGTKNNIKNTIENVIIFNTFKNAFNNYIGLFNISNTEIQIRNNKNSVFDSYINKWYNPETGNEFNYLVFGRVSTNESAKITEFNIEAKVCTLVLDTDKAWISTQSKPSNKSIDLELGATESQYKAPDNGWFVISGYDKGQGFDIANITNGIGYGGKGRTGDGFIRLSVPAAKDDIVGIYYTEFEKIQFKFVYDYGVI